MTTNDALNCWRDCKDRFRFETIVSELSTRFINLPVDHMDDAIVDAQRRVCECLGVDVCSLWRLSTDRPGTLLLTHYHGPPDFPTVPLSLDASEYSPWCLDMIRGGRNVVVPRVSQTPPEAARDRELWAYCGIKSLLTLPLSTGGGATFAAVNFCHIREEHEWEPQRIDRLRLVAQMLANALLRQESDRALRESQERLALATAAADAGLWVLNRAGTRFWINAKITELFGLPPGDELAIEQFFALIHAEDRKQVRTAMQKALETAALSVIEYRIVRPDGQLRWMNSCGRPGLRASDNQPAQLMGITADITDRKRAEGEAIELRRELAHVTRVYTMGELASSMAHELNQPLAAIIANTDAADIHARSAAPDLVEIQSILDDIRRDGLRAGDIIHRMRAFLQRREVEMLPLDVESLVRESVKFVETDAGTRKIAVRFEVEPEMTPAQGDRVQLQQVLLNLIVNGMDAMSSTPEKQRRLSVHARQVSADMVEISVVDRGHGIPPETIQQLFEPFFTTKSGGLGMGLPISRSIVEAHGGRLWLENNPVGGVAARFTLPLTSRGSRG